MKLPPIVSLTLAAIALGLASAFAADEKDAENEAGKDGTATATAAGQPKPLNAAGAEVPADAEKENGGLQAAKFMPLGRASLRVKIPQFDDAGDLSCMMRAEEMTRIDDEDIDIVDMDIEFMENGDSAMIIDLERATYNLTDRLISSDRRSVVKRADFTLVGDSLEFDTVNRHGRMNGKVRMVIHNSAGLTAAKDEAKAAPSTAPRRLRPGLSVNEAVRLVLMAAATERENPQPE